MDAQIERVIAETIQKYDADGDIEAGMLFRELAQRVLEIAAERVNNLKYTESASGLASDGAAKDCKGSLSMTPDNRPPRMGMCKSHPGEHEWRQYGRLHCEDWQPVAPEMEARPLCQEFVVDVIAGASWISCALQAGHDGGHRGQGNCVKHGPYLGEVGEFPRCPKWPDCAAPSPAVPAPQFCDYWTDEITAIYGTQRARCVLMKGHAGEHNFHGAAVAPTPQPPLGLCRNTFHPTKPHAQDKNCIDWAGIAETPTDQPVQCSQHFLRRMSREP